MIKNKSNLPEPHNHMLDNYSHAIDVLPVGHKSSHWDVFPEDYHRSIESVDAWSTFLRNPLSIGFNDDLLHLDNIRWKHTKHSQGVDGWELRRLHDYRELVDEIINDKEMQNKVLNQVNILFSICGPEFVINNLQPDIGSPSKVPVSYQSNNKQQPIKKFYASVHDLGQIYYFYQISRTIDPLVMKQDPVIMEIGAGYGGVISKIKNRYPSARCILFDLPELSAVQTYYIYNCFPKAKILYLNDLLERGDLIFEDHFDFMVLPGWMIDRVPSSYVDIVINMRSMMEMQLSIVDYYFYHIQRTIKSSGLFACFNRYHKNSHGEDVIMKKYPFDAHWSTIISQTSIYQNHIHDLILQRQCEEDDFPVADRLITLPPF